MEQWKAPVESKNSKIIERIIDNYRQEQQKNLESIKKKESKLMSSKLGKKMKKFHRT